MDVIEILEDKYKRMEKIESMFVNTTIYLKPMRQRTKTVNTLTQWIVHTEVKVNPTRSKKERTSHTVWTQFMQEVMGESKEEITKKYLLN